MTTWVNLILINGWVSSRAEEKMHRKCYRTWKAAEEIGAEGQGEGLQGEVKKIEPFEKFDGFGQITERVKLLSKKESVFMDHC